MFPQKCLIMLWFPLANAKVTFLYYALFVYLFKELDLPLKQASKRTSFLNSHKVDSYVGRQNRDVVCSFYHSYIPEAWMSFVTFLCLPENPPKFLSLLLLPLSLHRISLVTFKNNLSRSVVKYSLWFI